MTATATDRRQLREDLTVAALTVDRLVRVFGDISDDFPLIARMVDDLAIVRQDIDDAAKELEGGSR